MAGPVKRADGGWHDSVEHSLIHGNGSLRQEMVRTGKKAAPKLKLAAGSG